MDHGHHLDEDHGHLPGVDHDHLLGEDHGRHLDEDHDRHCAEGDHQNVPDALRAVLALELQQLLQPLQLHASLSLRP